MPKITDALAKSLPLPATGNRIHYDSEIAGFGIRVTAGGTKAFVLNYRAKGRERRYTIGTFSKPSKDSKDGKASKDSKVWSVEAARKRAIELRRLVDAEKDPMAEKHAERGAPTVGILIDQFTDGHIARKRPSTRRQYTGILENLVRPKLGKTKVADVTHADIEKLHHKVSDRAPYVANRMAAVLSKMFAFAIKRRWCADNPVKGLERNDEERRERFLSSAEIGSLSTALAELNDQRSANAIRLLLLTGARSGEVLAADWSQFDLEAGVWVKPSSHTKQKKSHRVPLSAPALQLLVEMRAKAADPAHYLFPGDKKGTCLTTIKKSWATATRAAGLTDIRVHDLRHTYASILASGGSSLPIIGRLLGHTQAQTTARYAHLLDDPLRAATERVGAIVGAAGRKGADVVPLQRIGRGRDD